MKIIVVGGVAGGATAATRLRRLSEKNEIIIFEKGEHVSFANCGLPYHIGGTIPDRDKLLLQTPESLKIRYNLDTRIFTEVLAINREQKTVTAKNLTTGKIYDESYDKLLLSPGAEPLRPPLEGINSRNILTLRNIADMDRIIQKTQTKNDFVIVGGGFIGLEIAENLIKLGKKVRLVELNNQVMAQADFEMASYIHHKAKEHGLGLLLNHGVQKFVDTEHGLEVHLQNHKVLKTDVVILSIGVKPENTLAKNAGLDIGATGGILVNPYLQTNDEDIYAVGDAIEVTHFVHQKKVHIPLAWPANRQGRLVADNMIKGNISPYSGSMGSSILKFFELSLAATGLNEKTLKKLEMDYHTIIVTKGHHAGYYPGAKDLLLKVLFDGFGNILGAQAVGEKGVDKRIDIIATAIKAKMNIRELQDIEITYAPSFNSAKDPVNIVGYAAENMLKGDLHTLNYDQLENYVKKHDAVLIDVRTPLEFIDGHIEGAVNLPVDDIREKISSLDKNRKYLVYCQVGLRGYLAHRILKNFGFDVINLNGGYNLWSKVHTKKYELTL